METKIILTLYGSASSGLCFLYGFLTLLFAAAFVIKYDKILDLKTMITSYALISGIGYVWVIRVFLIVSLLAPILGVFNTRIRSNLIFIMALMFIQVIFDVSFSSLKNLNPSIFHLLSITILDVLPFSLVFLFGMRMSTFNHREQSRLTFLFCLIFIGYARFFYTTEHVFVSTQDYKNPPASYYLSYALFVSMLLCLFKEQVIKIFQLISGVVHHLSMNSIWTYLWHIPLVFALHINWLAKFIVVYVIAGSISWAQVQFVKYLSSKEFINDKSKKLINNLFTG